MVFFSSRRRHTRYWRDWSSDVCSSDLPIRTRHVDVEGTERLLGVAGRAGVSHFHFISVVGVDRNPYFPYYRLKLETERIVERSEVPWTILRATQFHGFILLFVRPLGRLPDRKSTR